jgi:hypothetical protein
MMRPVVYISPAVFVQAWKDAFAFACSRGLDKAKFNARRARAERGDLLDEELAALDDDEPDTYHARDVLGDDAARAHADALRAFVVTCDAHTYDIDAIDRNEAAKAARKQHATLGRAPCAAWRVRSK